MKFLFVIFFTCFTATVFAQSDSTQTNILLREPLEYISVSQELNLYKIDLTRTSEKERVNKVLGYTGFILGEFIRASKLNELNSCSPNLY